MSQECCQQEISFLKERLEKLDSDTKQLKREYQNSLVENLQKDCIIRKLKQKLKDKQSLEPTVKPCEYVKFKGILSDTCLENLKLIGNLQRDDSRFISTALNDLYRENVDVLKKKTLGGRSKDKDKTVLTPEKVNTLEKLFAERMAFISTAEVDNSRKNSVHKLIRNSIDNANRRKKLM